MGLDYTDSVIFREMKDAIIKSNVYLESIAKSLKKLADNKENNNLKL